MTTTDTEPDVTPEMVAAFKTAWAEADAAGLVGGRVDAGLRAALAVSSSLAPVARVELFTDAAGEHRWRAVARNGVCEIVATSGEGYRNASDCRGIVEAMFPGIEIREAD
jgi:uncharacterized protein YegP (UPF0339 family)